MVQQVKNLLANAERYRRRELDPWVGKIPLEEEMGNPSSTLARDFCGQRSLGGLQAVELQRAGHE